jgi:hypothetical protein
MFAHLAYYFIEGFTAEFGHGGWPGGPIDKLLVALTLVGGALFMYWLAPKKHPAPVLLNRPSSRFMASERR